MTPLPILHPEAAGKQASLQRQVEQEVVLGRRQLIEELADMRGFMRELHEGAHPEDKRHFKWDAYCVVKPVFRTAPLSLVVRIVSIQLLAVGSNSYRDSDLILSKSGQESS